MASTFSIAASSLRPQEKVPSLGHAGRSELVELVVFIAITA